MSWTVKPHDLGRSCAILGPPKGEWRAAPGGGRNTALGRGHAPAQGSLGSRRHRRRRRGRADRSRSTRARPLRDPGRLRRRRRVRRRHHRRMGSRPQQRPPARDPGLRRGSREGQRAARSPVAPSATSRLWAGITAPSPEETLENLELAVACGAAAAVLAPLSIQGVDDPVRFVARDVADVLDAQPRRIPIYLYDNADIAVDPKVPHIRTRQVKALSRLDFVRGIKVSAPRKVLGNYTKAAASFNERGEFAIYVGDAMLIFDLFRPRTRLARHGRRSLESLAPLGRAAGRRRRGPGERVAARVGARLAGVPRGRRRAHGGGARSARGVPRRHARDRRPPHHRVSQARAARARRDLERSRRARHAVRSRDPTPSASTRSSTASASWPRAASARRG